MSIQTCILCALQSITQAFLCASDRAVLKLDRRLERVEEARRINIKSPQRERTIVYVT